MYHVYQRNVGPSQQSGGISRNSAVSILCGEGWPGVCNINLYVIRPISSFMASIINNSNMARNMVA
jgi:hypothetical protein